MEETLYTVCAAAGGTLVLVQVVLQTLGLFGEVDIDTDTDDFDADGHGNVLFGMLSFKALCAFAAIFGLVGLIMLNQDTSFGARVGVAVGSGVVGMFVVASLMRGLSKLQSSGTLDLNNAIGKTGSCYLRIPANGKGAGKVTIEVQGRAVELAARTEGEEIPTGTRVRVISVDSDNTVGVQPA